jgi:hypothetical protein
MTMSSSGGSDNEGPVHNDKKYSQLTAAHLQTIFYTVRSTMVDGRPKHGIFTKIARQLLHDRVTIWRQWKQMKRKLALLLNNQPEEDHHGIIAASSHILFATGHSSRRKGKFLYNRQELKEAAEAVEQDKRPTLRHLAAHVGVPLTTLYYLLKGRKPPTYKNGETIFVRHSSKLKPTLTDQNKVHRFLFASSQVRATTIGLRGGVQHKFDGQYNKVHIDEKWFWLSKDGKKYILVEGEEAPKRNVKHKKYMSKVMFLCAIARPRYDYTKNCWWDGKLGMWPIGYYDKAQRSSVNRPAGTRVWKNQNMDFAVFRMMIIDDLIPAIQALWPAGEWNDNSFKIIVQQDGAGSHPKTWNDSVIQATLRELEQNGNFTPGKITFEAQPPNSPDTNICDLGLFNAVQSAYYLTAPKNHIEIINMVTKAYNEYPRSKINRLFVTLMSIYNSIIEHYGDNFFKIPHLNKDKMEREGTLPRELPLTPEAIHILEAYNSGEPLTDSDVEIDDDEADEILDTLRGTDTNNHSDDDEASTNSNYSLNSEELAIYAQVEAEMGGTELRDQLT